MKKLQRQIELLRMHKPQFGVVVPRNVTEPAANRLEKLMNLVDEQSEDEGLWFVAETAAEAYLQQELRKLHAAVEDE